MVAFSPTSYERSDALAPGHEWTLGRLAMLARWREDHDAATELAERLRGRSPWSVSTLVTAGDVLAIAMLSEGDNPAYLWSGSSAEDYAGGSAYRRVFSPVWEVPPFANDWAFRTFVEPATGAPAPATALLLGPSLVAIGWARRRKTPA